MRPENKREDSRFERFVWLIKVSEACRLLTAIYSDVDDLHQYDPTDAFFIGVLCVLNELLLVQTTNTTEIRGVRLGSQLTWFQTRFSQEEDSSDYDPHLDSPERDTSQQETFLEQTYLGHLAPEANEELRSSRHILLRGLKTVLHDTGMDGFSVKDALQRAFTYVLRAFDQNLFLQTWWPDVAAVRNSPNLAHSQARFVARLRFDFIYTYINNFGPRFNRIDAQSSAVIRESDILFRSLRDFIDRHGERVVYDGFRLNCQFFEQWFHRVTTRSELYEATCPVCYENYEFADDMQDSARPSVLPVQLQCKHILCRKCFKGWVKAYQENHNLCPLCRAKAIPDNTHRSDLQKTVHQLQHTRDPESTIEIASFYLSRLPLQYRDDRSVIITLSISLYLDRWRQNMDMPITASSQFQVVPYYMPHPRHLHIFKLHILRDRAQAAVQGDQARFNEARKAFIQTLALDGLNRYTKAVNEWVRDYTTEQQSNIVENS